MAQCPVCQTKYTKAEDNYCSICSWDLTEHTLSPQGLAAEQQLKIDWAKKIWKIFKEDEERIKQLNNEINELNKEKKQLSYDKYRPFTGGFNRLEYWLNKEEWKEADIETALIILAQAHRIREGFLRKNNDLKEFSFNELSEIDKLWLKYSKGRFGFSVQKYIYESLGGTREYNQEVWESFTKKVGWCCDIPDFDKKGYWKYIEDIGDNALRVKLFRSGYSSDWRWGYRSKSLSFNLFAPPGHLPFLRVGGFGNDGALGEKRVIFLLANCGLKPRDPVQHCYIPPIPGKDIRIARKSGLTFDEAKLGFTKEIPFERMKTCETCFGTGAIPDSCKDCDGKGRIKEAILEYKVTIPSEESRFCCPQNIRISFKNNGNCIEYWAKGEGDAGEYGGEAGDLWIIVECDD
jgi:hypothetical protein